MSEFSEGREKLLSSLKAYIPYNEQEEKDLPVLLSALKNTPDIFLRSSALAHMTASAWVVNPKRTKVLMAYHNIYQSWSWLGGHADGDTDLLRVAVKEVKEESGIQQVRALSEDIFSLEILTVDGHIKKGSYVPCHLHLNLTYLLEADDICPLAVREGENSAVSWFSPEEAVQMSTEPWFCDHIYTKLNQKLFAFNLAHAK